MDKSQKKLFCQSASEQLSRIHELNFKFYKAIESAKVSVEYSKARDYKIQLENAIHELQTNIWYEQCRRYDPRTLEHVTMKKNYTVCATLEAHKDGVYALQVLPDLRIVSGGGDNTIKIWDGIPVGSVGSGLVL